MRNHSSRVRYDLYIYDALGRKVARKYTYQPAHILLMRERARAFCMHRDVHFPTLAPHYVLYEEREIRP